MNATQLWNVFLLLQNREPTTDEKFRFIKTHRNNLLAECDWTQLPDAVLTEAERTAWQDYRQALQVIEFSNPNPDLIVFPDPPLYVNGQPPAEVLDYRASRADMKAQVIAALARLEQIETATTFTNAQVIQAIKDMATYEKKIIKVLARII